MKTSQIARGIVGALSLMGVIGAVGCGAVGPDGEYAEGEIGETSQALTAAQARQKTAACTIVDSVTGAERFLYAGGIDSTPSVKAEIFESTNGSTFTALGTSLHVARFDLSAIVPDASRQICVFVGGDTVIGTKTPSKAVDVVTVANGVFTVTTATDLNVARILPSLDTCASKIIAMGGVQSNGDGIKSLEVSNNSSATAAWTTGANVSAVGRGRASFVKDSDNRYGLAGGIDTSGNNTGTVEAVTLSSCASPVFTDLVNASTPIALTRAVEGIVGVRTAVAGNVSTFKFLAGRQSASTLNDKEDTINVDWSAILASSTQGAAANVTFSYQPMLAFDSAGVPYMIGGSNAAESAPSLLVKHYAGSTLTADTALPAGHYRGAASRLGATTVVVNTGNNIGTGLSIATDTY